MTSRAPGSNSTGVESTSQLCHWKSLLRHQGSKGYGCCRTPFCFKSDRCQCPDPTEPLEQYQEGAVAALFDFVHLLSSTKPIVPQSCSFVLRVIGSSRRWQTRKHKRRDDALLAVLYCHRWIVAPAAVELKVKRTTMERSYRSDSAFVITTRAPSLQLPIPTTYNCLDLDSHIVASLEPYLLTRSKSRY